jgi:hypothetical protein
MSLSNPFKKPKLNAKYEKKSELKDDQWILNYQKSLEEKQKKYLEHHRKNKIPLPLIFKGAAKFNLEIGVDYGTYMAEQRIKKALEAPINHEKKRKRI